VCAGSRRVVGDFGALTTLSSHNPLQSPSFTPEPTVQPRARGRNAATSSQERVLTTASGPSHARRAVATP
jgi:hypothetical protein